MTTATSRSGNSVVLVSVEMEGLGTKMLKLIFYSYRRRDELLGQTGQHRQVQRGPHLQHLPA